MVLSYTAWLSLRPAAEQPRQVGLVDEVAEAALQSQSFGGEGAGGVDGAGVFVPKPCKRWHSLLASNGRLVSIVKTCPKYFATFEW